MSSSPASANLRSCFTGWQSSPVALVDWRRVLRPDDGYELWPGAGAGQIAAAEAALEAAFPDDLRQLYLTSNGVLDTPGQWFVIWPIADVVTRNRDAWLLEGSPARRSLVGFGDDGTGAPFCVPRDGSSGVYAWSAIDNEATWLAETAAGFWPQWAAGTLPPH
jgi:hypothetical protein